MFTPEALASYVSLAIFTVINLLAAYLILKHFLFKPILRMLRKRRQLISDELAQAEETLDKAKEKMSQAEERLDGTTREASVILAEARSQAERQSELQLTDARQSAAGLVTRAETEVNRMRITMLNDVRNEVADLSVAIASKVIGQAMDERRQRELVEKFLDDDKDQQQAAGPQAEVSDHA